MKLKIFIALLAFTTATRAQDADTCNYGPHGGLLNTVKNYKIESLSEFGCVTVYIYDKSLTAISNKFASGEIVFFYDHAMTITKRLTPRGVDEFNVDVSNNSYTSYKVHFMMKEETIESRFLNYLEFVTK
jgi:hypothetical protein